jgi:hypothetical protein
MVAAAGAAAAACTAVQKPYAPCKELEDVPVVQCVHGAHLQDTIAAGATLVKGHLHLAPSMTVALMLLVQPYCNTNRLVFRTNCLCRLLALCSNDSATVLKWSDDAAALLLCSSDCADALCLSFLISCKHLNCAEFLSPAQQAHCWQPLHGQPTSCSTRAFWLLSTLLIAWY